ncbi:sulfatase [Cellulophaga sp. Hel_I_12]|uniref:sulfatase family protein n=1 Tax=Cellulophaga sp. Hel_I_12 TaxID=1249972 RepID=UPI000645E928|nr:sulfatase [Cellulophaga sp. Hel_I_12]
MLKFNYVVLSIFLLFGCKKKDPELKQSSKPNIIFLLTDDQRWDALGATGNTILKTPNIDELAEEGQLYMNSYVTTSICMVSRASILSGQYESKHGINDFFTSFTKEDFDSTYPALLKKNGYRTGFVGKYGVGNPKDQPKEAFNFWAVTPLHQPNYENKDKDGNYIHYTELLSQHIDEFLNGANEKPFCLSVSFKSPHSQDGDPRQFIPNPKYADHYKNDIIPLPETANPIYWDALPDFFHSDENIARQRWKLRFETQEKYQESVKNYYRLITGVDDAVAKLREELKEKGLDKNTIIIFMGDNGFYLGEHGLAGKWFGHEESIRVPLIVYDPRHKPSKSKVENIGLNIDIAPTILGYAGVDKPAGMQGIDLSKKNNSRQDFFYEHTFEGSPKLPKVEGVVSPTTKYMIYIEHGYEELFDLIKDSNETKNLVSDPNYKQLLETQRRRYQVLKLEVKK